MNSLIIISGIAYLLVGIFIGFFIAIDRAVKSPELQARLDELREIRYEAEKARTMFAVAKMMERVNKNILLSMIDNFNKQMEKNLENLKKSEQENAKDS